MDFLEVTTVIGCGCGCLKYCPQEVTVKKYGIYKDRVMSLDTYRQILANTPREVCIVFAGYAEPFQNPDCLQMVKDAFDTGHQVGVHTTLNGVTWEAVEYFKQQRFFIFCVHMPDGKVLKRNSDPDFVEKFFTLQTSIENMQCMSMNGNFKTCGRENVTRGKLPKPTPFGFCQRFIETAPVVLPSGEAYLCCMDFGLKHPLGDLTRDNYSEVRGRLLSGKGGFWICNYCDCNVHPLKHMFYRLLNTVLKPTRRLIH